MDKTSSVSVKDWVKRTEGMRVSAYIGVASPLGSLRLPTTSAWARSQGSQSSPRDLDAIWDQQIAQDSQADGPLAQLAEQALAAFEVGDCTEL